MFFPFSNLLRRSSARRRHQSVLGSCGRQVAAQFCVERLEDRTLPAGNVIASLSSGGRLTLVGDDAGNEVSAVVDAMGQLVATGQNGTTINGQTQVTIPAAAIAKVVVNLQGGDDVLAVDGGMAAAAAGGDAWIQLGTGDDRLDLTNLAFDGNLTVYGSDGNDSVALTNTAFRSIFVGAGTGNDMVDLNNVRSEYNVRLWGQEGDDTIGVSGAIIDRSLLIPAGYGNDTVNVGNVTTRHYIRIWGQVGNDTIGIDDSSVGTHAYLNGGAGDDDIEVTGTQIGNYLWITGKSGDDTVLVDDVAVGTSLLILGWEGHDVFTVRNATADRVSLIGGKDHDDIRVDTIDVRLGLRVFTGGGNDLVNIEDSHIGGLLFWKGDTGHDAIGICSTTVDGKTFLLGGLGDDLIGIFGSTFNKSVHVHGAAGHDAVELNDALHGPSTFNGKFHAHMGPGNDVGLVTGMNTFRKAVVINGGLGVNELAVTDDQNLARDPRIKKFRIIAEDVVQARLDVLEANLTAIFPDFMTTCFGPGGGVIVGDNPQIVLVVDVSGSTGNVFQGTPVGDVNGDGDANTILDAELAALIAFHDEFAAANLGPESTISIVVFGSSAAVVDLDPATPGAQSAIAPGADVNMNGIPDFNEAVAGILEGAQGVGTSTDYEDALRVTAELFPTILTPDGDPNVVFLSDGFPNSNTFDDEVATLTGIGANLIAFGVGQGASLTSLQIIDMNARIFDSTDDFIQAITDLFT